MKRRLLMVLCTLLAVPVGVQAQTAHASSAAPPATAATTTVPAPGLPLLPNVNDQAFKQVEENAAPLSPAQIEMLRRLVDGAERAAATPPRITPKPVSTAVTANLAPGKQPPVVRLFDGYVTSILFIDAAGELLPIVSADLMKGEFKAFPIDKGSNVLKLIPATPYATGNISVTLSGVSAPVVLTLVSGQRDVDYRVDVRVTGGNVSARLATKGDDWPQTNPTMLEFLSGLIPDGARALVTDNPDVQVWALNGSYYVRTALSLLSPAYTNPGKSSDGTSFYQIPPTPVLVVSAAGVLKHVNVETP